MYNYITNFILRKISCSVCIQIQRTCNLNNETSVAEHHLAFWQRKFAKRTVAWESTVLYRSDISFRSATGNVKDIPIKMLNFGCKVTENNNRGTTWYCTVQDNESIFKCIFATNLQNRLTFSKIICIDGFQLRTDLYKKETALSNIGLTS